MSERDTHRERLELALEAAGLDLWENDLVTGEVPIRVRKTLAELGYADDDAPFEVDDIFKLIHSDDVPVVLAAVTDHLTGLTPQYRCELRMRAKSGEWIWYANYGKAFDGHSDTPGRRFIGVTFNINDRKRHEEALALRAQEWRTLTENSPDIIARYAPDLRRSYVNPAFGAMVEGGVKALLGTTPAECPGGPDIPLYEAHLRRVFARGIATSFELQWSDKDGNVVWNHFRLTPEFDADGTIISILAVGRDITELKNYQAELKAANQQLEALNTQLHALAAIDELTQLANRRTFDGRFSDEWQRHVREQKPLAVIIGDVDLFKAFNDGYGHLAGDNCLRRIAACYREQVQRSGDLAARYGGEEFIVIMPATNLDGACHLAEKLLAAVRDLQIPHAYSNVAPYVTISLGIASVIPAPERPPEGLMSAADAMLYRAKASGRNRYSAEHASDYAPLPSTP